ncbi:unnamed protein product [Eruca vesicaria subsp. sativa]|uniref:Uncharacterized protein n=1 Tax=Eruca vesicaria subsp. sativa TaxID=29727 RepID=A0ABC8JHB8_ERUVS|nr:unnamed protein product [Eruca vesicaria subsp. sativa]
MKKSISFYVSSENPHTTLFSGHSNADWSHGNYIARKKGCLLTRKEDGMSVELTFSVSCVSSHVPSKHRVRSLGLKDHSSEVLKDIEAAVIENRLWYMLKG